MRTEPRRRLRPQWRPRPHPIVPPPQPHPPQRARFSGSRCKSVACRPRLESDLIALFSSLRIARLRNFEALTLHKKEKAL